MPLTYAAIATTTVGAGGTSAITFNSIPADYTDLLLKFSLRSTSTNSTVLLNINNSSSDFTGRDLYGNGSTVTSNNYSANYSGYQSVSTNTTSAFGSGELYIPNYTASTNKSYFVDAVSETNSSTAYSGIHALLWAQTSAITRLDISMFGGNLAQYSTATLYGINKS